jgi:hypothetical protein
MLGLLGAHILDYELLFRNAAVRSGMLRQTGHSYFGHALEFAIVSAVLAVIGTFALGFARARRSHTDRMSTVRVGAVLALIQSGGFVVLEAGERFAAHAIAQQLLRVTILGVVLQCTIAAITAVVLALVERAGEIVARALRSAPPVRQAVSTHLRPAAGPHPRRVVFSPASPRAPPFAFTS